MRRRPSRSIAKNENPSGTGAGTGRPRLSELLLGRGERPRAGPARPCRAASRKSATVGARGSSSSGSSTSSGSGLHEVEQRLDERFAVGVPGALRAREGVEDTRRSVVAGASGAEGLDDAANGVRDREPADRLAVLAVRALEDELLRSLGRRPRGLAISCRSWSSVSAQKTGTAGTPLPRELAREVDRVEALSSG